MTAFRAVAVHADDRDQRRVEGPEHIGLRHRAARRVAVIGADDGRLGTEIPDKGLQTGLARRWIDIAVVISRNRDDGGRILQIGLVKLRPVIGTLAIIINDVAEMIEKRRSIRGIIIQGKIAFHESRHAVYVS